MLIRWDIRAFHLSTTDTPVTCVCMSVLLMIPLVSFSVRNLSQQMNTVRTWSFYTALNALIDVPCLVLGLLSALIPWRTPAFLSVTYVRRERHRALVWGTCVGHLCGHLCGKLVWGTNKGGIAAPLVLI